MVSELILLWVEVDKVDVWFLKAQTLLSAKEHEGNYLIDDLASLVARLTITKDTMIARKMILLKTMRTNMGM